MKGLDAQSAGRSCIFVSMKVNRFGRTETPLPNYYQFKLSCRQSLRAILSTMTLKESLLQEIEEIPEDFLPEIWKFIEYLKYKQQQNQLETTLLSESALAKDWSTLSEEQAWQDL